MSEDTTDTQPLPKSFQPGEQVTVALFGSGVVKQSFSHGAMLEVEVEARPPLQGKMFVMVSKDIVTRGN